MPFHESFAEFQSRMGCGHEFVHNRYLFRNGGQSNEFNHIDPPTDPVELRKLELEFLEHRLKRETAEFNDFQTYVSEQTAMKLRYPNVVGPPLDAVDSLKQGQGRIFRLREQIQNIKSDPATESRDTIQQRIVDAIKQEQKQQVQQLALEASQISI